MPRTRLIGRRSARFSLRASTALVSASFLAHAAPAMAQTVITNTSPTYSSAQTGNSPAEPRTADSGEAGTDGSAGGQPSDQNIAFAAGSVASGTAGSTTVSLTNNGGRGANGGQAGDVTLFHDFTNGGNAGSGGSAGSVTFEQRGSTDAISVINGVDQAAVSLTAAGGDGGRGGNPGNYGKGGAGGAGGDGGVLTFNQQDGAAIDGAADSVAAVTLDSTGGRGGNSESAKTSSDKAYGQDGGAAGVGGVVNATISGTISSKGSGVVATSTGGRGGDGGDASTTGVKGAQGGVGGDGGSGGMVLLNLVGGSVSATGAAQAGTGDKVDLDAGKSITFSTATAGLQAVVRGGQAGAGGSGTGNFSKGVGGKGGSATANSTAYISTSGGSIATTGYGASGAVMQNIGGEGGNGSFGGGVFVSKGGEGGTGGDGGGARFEATEGGTITTEGDSSHGVVAQSIGGGGGIGGDSQVAGIIAGVSLGGQAGSGGNGGGAAVWNGAHDDDFTSFANGALVETSGYKSHGLIAQSIGGGGGIGGDANALVAGGFISIAVGGAAGNGGVGGVAEVENGGVVQTHGDWSFGEIAQSVGGGGGDGGSANSFDIGAQLTVASAVGGSGGTGGMGGDATANNYRQITTDGDNSFGMLAQSVGGGGGNGGASMARTLQVYNDKEAPSLDLDISLGGSAGSGGVGGKAQIYNAGAVLTGGAGSIGVFAQSVGGGGGNGGDADAMSQAYQASSINISTAIGGKGGSGGTGGEVDVYNNGVITTLGDEATAVFAQSVGGGGGNGGAGQADRSVYDEKEASIAVDVGLGGRGGAAGDGGSVNVTNASTGIMTFGTKANGVFAQSVGGGGGNAGGGTAKGGGGQLTVNVAVGGHGGGGGAGGAVAVSNDASILTAGADSAGIFAQSVGGGGGSGGSAATGSGESLQVTVADMLADRMGVDADVIETGNGFYELREKGGQAWSDIKTLKSAFGAIKDKVSGGEKAAEGAEKEGSEISVNVGAGVGGGGGSAGDGGKVTLTNTGYIETYGASSEGIFAQSVGGGGGTGGGVDGSNGLGTLAGSVNVGGHGGSVGNGGELIVGNTGSIKTHGDVAHGIYAQSAGAGGGKGGVSVGDSSLLNAFEVTLGGFDSSDGSGGHVQVQSSGSISTDGSDAIGIVAQSIGGGGGSAAVMEVNDDTGESEVASNGFKIGPIPIKLSGTSGSGVAEQQGDGNTVEVGLNAGSIQTSGRNAYGILAQSIGGGGGLVLGVSGNEDATANDFFGADQVQGRGGDVNVKLDNATKIVTKGDGAAGIIAQSIGGGGGIVGGLADVDITAGGQTLKRFTHFGQAGNVTVDVEGNSFIQTSGKNAHGIVAQAAGGGGGFFGKDDGSGYAVAGSYGLCVDRCSGAINVTYNGVIEANGEGSWGIFAQTHGNGNNTVTMNGGGVVSGAAGGIYIDNATNNNTINNVGWIVGPTAISTTGSGTLNNGYDQAGAVVISGDILSGGGGWDILNRGSGRIIGAKTIQSRSFNNQGELWIGARNYTAGDRTEVTSDLTSTGRLIFDVDFTNGVADRLVVDGKAAVGGQILITPVNPVQVRDVEHAIPIIDAAGGLTLNNPTVHTFTYNDATDGLVINDNQYLYKFNVVQMTSTEAGITASSNLSAAATGLRKNNVSLANHLEGLWNGGSSTGGDQVLSALVAGVNSRDGYQRALDSMSASTLGFAAASRGMADRTFTTAMMSCADLTDSAPVPTEDSCSWARAGGGEASSHANGISSGLDSTSYTAQIGGQKVVGDGWLVGGSLAYENSDTSSDTHLASIKGDSVLAGLSLKHQAGPLTVTGALTGGLGWFSSNRTIQVGDVTSVAKASPQTEHVGAHAKLSYSFAGKTLYLQPQLAVDATYVHFDRIKERNSPFALDVAGNGDVIASASSAFEFGARLKSGTAVIRPYVRGGATFYDERDWTSSARLAGTTGSIDRFTSATSLPETVAQVGAGVDVMSASKFDLKFEYDGEFAKDFSSNRGFIRFGYHF